MGWVRGLRVLAIVGAGVFSMGAGGLGWLSICSKCVTASITSATGLGTAHAAIEAKVGLSDVRDWCANWEPESKTCVKDQMASDEFGQVLKATADCTAGRMTTQGETYVYAGVWDNSDIGGGRSKWRGSDGTIVGRSNAAGGLGLSQHWEELCPKGLVRAAGAPSPRPAAPAAQPVAGALYSVGQEVEARYMSDWIRARVIRLHPTGAGVDYEVNLANGAHGIVPARMLRPLSR